MASILVNGVNLFYGEYGAKDAQALVLLHGFPLNGEMWKVQTLTFSESCRVIVPDFRGFGKSAETGPFSIEELADDIHALVGHLHLEKIILCGLSMGGYVALAY